MSLRDWGWFVIIQKTRGLIGLPNPEEELRQLEEKANATYGEYKKALDLTAELEQSNIQIQEEIKELTSTLAKAQGDISQYGNNKKNIFFQIKLFCSGTLRGRPRPALRRSSWRPSWPTPSRSCSRRRPAGLS